MRPLAQSSPSARLRHPPLAGNRSAPSPLSVRTPARAVGLHALDELGRQVVDSRLRGNDSCSSLLADAPPSPVAAFTPAEGGGPGGEDRLSPRWSPAAVQKTNAIEAIGVNPHGFNYMRRILINRTHCSHFACLQAVTEKNGPILENRVSSRTRIRPITRRGLPCPKTNLECPLDSTEMIPRVLSQGPGEQIQTCGARPKAGPVVYSTVMARASAGLVMYRVKVGKLEVLLVHPGGPFWAKKEAGAWFVPKGEIEPDEPELAAARREFEEETGLRPEEPFRPLGTVKHKGGKTVTAWAFEGDCDPATLKSNTFTLEWPPRSGKRSEFPEVDRAAFFTLEEAKSSIHPDEFELLLRLQESLKQSASPASAHARSKS